MLLQMTSEEVNKRQLGSPYAHLNDASQVV